MGEQYRQRIEEKISELGADNLRVFINDDGVTTHYRLEDTFRHAGVRFALSREEANLVFEGNHPPSYRTGQVVGFFRETQLMFVGAL
ncbi:MAG TPA: hypothetical protein VGJ48_05240 [Pyrinomonadaceae bacterium]|jgi:hypothetical protein